MGAPTIKQRLRQLFTPIKARSSERVHAVGPGASRTVCGRPFVNWVITDAWLNCPDCKLEILKLRQR